jgi:YgiT-type zinc finger domain-containing protein
MRCAVCRNGETAPGTTTVTLERDSRVVVIRGVPAEVCGTCGHAVTGAETTERVFEMAEALLSAGAEVGVREYEAA